MEGSKDKRGEKRGYESVDPEQLAQSKKPKLPGLARYWNSASCSTCLEAACSYVSMKNLALWWFCASSDHLSN